MTFNDLMKAYYAGEPGPEGGVRAVLKALLDDTAIKSCACKFWLDDILASDGVEAAAGSATAQTEGDVHDADREGERQRCVPQGVSAVDGRGEGSAGADQGQRFGTVQRDRGRSAQQDAITGTHEAGRGGDVGSQRHHGVSRGEAAGGPAREDEVGARTPPGSPAADLVAMVEAEARKPVPYKPGFPAAKEAAAIAKGDADD